jgi:hypothetical protein
MIAGVAMVIFGSILIAIAIAWAVGPVRLLAGLIAVPLIWGIFSVAVLAMGGPVASRGGSVIAAHLGAAARERRRGTRCLASSKV